MPILYTLRKLLSEQKILSDIFFMTKIKYVLCKRRRVYVFFIIIPDMNFLEFTYIKSRFVLSRQNLFHKNNHILKTKQKAAHTSLFFQFQTRWFCHENIIKSYSRISKDSALTAFTVTLYSTNWKTLSWENRF